MDTTPDIEDREKLGQRERNKRDKLRRIKAAAWELFLDKGYDAATTREIAVKARVGLGTVFSYAADKRDLLFLIYNDQQEFLIREAFTEVPEDRPFAEQVVHVFGPYYRYYAEEPNFARYLLRELTFYHTGLQAQRFTTGRERMHAGIEDLAKRAVDRGLVKPECDPRMLARTVFGIFQSECRRWLAGKDPQPEDGLEQLGSVLGMVAAGFDARAG